MHVNWGDCVVVFRCVLTCLERKCGNSLEKLRCALGEYLQNGIHTSDLLERAVSFITLKRVLLSHDGYSKYSRDLLRLFPDHTEDVAALCSEEWTSHEHQEQNSHKRLNINTSSLSYNGLNVNYNFILFSCEFIFLAQKNSFIFLFSQMLILCIICIIL